MTTDPIRIANCSGFLGDRLSGAREMVEGGPIDVLTGDWLAELTMLILSRIRARNPGGGYARSFVTQMEQVMGTCLDRGISVVSNAGGLDPAGCAAAVEEVADRLGLHPRVAWVDGDDLLDRVVDLSAAGELVPFTSDADLGDLTNYVTANAYLGCWGIVDALSAGADIVICGRVTDAAVVCGPAAHHHGWARDDWDALAGAVAAGHLIECSGQVTGGNYSFFTEVPGADRIGFPWAEVAADGSCIIGKHEGTGGVVSVGTVTSQFLYEIAGGRYAGPDVTARFDTAEITQVAPDRVRVSGVRGEPPTGTLKVAMNELGGYRQDMVVAITGLDIEAKAELAEAAFWAASPVGPDDVASCTVRLDRTDTEDPASNAAATARLSITLKDPDERRVGRAVSNAMIETALSSIPGMYLLSGAPGAGRPYGVYRPALVDATLVPSYVHLGDRTVQVPATDPRSYASVDVVATVDAVPPLGDVSLQRVPLGEAFGARSGDKGGDANVGVFARNDAGWAWLRDRFDSDMLRELLPEAAALDIDRHELANLRAVNFVIHGMLQEGVAASTRTDAQAKSLGEWLRARLVDLPIDVIHS